MEGDSVDNTASLFECQTPKISHLGGKSPDHSSVFVCVMGGSLRNVFRTRQSLIAGIDFIVYIVLHPIQTFLNIPSLIKPLVLPTFLSMLHYHNFSRRRIQSETDAYTALNSII